MDGGSYLGFYFCFFFLVDFSFVWREIGRARGNESQRVVGEEEIIGIVLIVRGSGASTFAKDLLGRRDIPPNSVAAGDEVGQWTKFAYKMNFFLQPSMHSIHVHKFLLLLL